MDQIAQKLAQIVALIFPYKMREKPKESSQQWLRYKLNCVWQIDLEHFRIFDYISKVEAWEIEVALLR